MLRPVPDRDAIAGVTEFSFAASPRVLDPGPLGLIWQVAGHLGFEALIDPEIPPAVAIADPATLGEERHGAGLPFPQ